MGESEELEVYKKFQKIGEANSIFWKKLGSTHFTKGIMNRRQVIDSL